MIFDFKGFFASLIQPQLAKALVWTAKQTLGPVKGTQVLATNSILAGAALSAASNLAGSALVNAAGHGILGKANDAIAKVQGLTTTEQSLSALGDLTHGTSLNLTPALESLLASFLSNTLVQNGKIVIPTVGGNNAGGSPA